MRSPLPGLVALIAILFSLSALAERERNHEFVGVQALVADAERDRLFVALQDARQVAVLRLPDLEKVRTITLDMEPSGLVLSRDGQKLYAVGGGAEGRLVVVDTESADVLEVISAGHTPVAAVLSSDGREVYVCNRFSNRVSVVDLLSHEVDGWIEVPREPVAAVLSRDGERLFVANHLPVGPSTAAHVAAEITVIDTRTRDVVRQITLPDGSTGVRDLTTSADGRHLYVPHVLARYTLLTTQLERGWMNTNALSIVEAERMEFVETVLLDDVDRGAANPWGVAVSPGGHIGVTHAGTHEVSIIDASRLLAKIDDRTSRHEVQLSPSNTLSFLKDVRRRVALPGLGPRSAAVADGRLYVGEYFSNSIAVVELDDPSAPPRSAHLGSRTLADPKRKGERYFNDATLCFQTWQSCASCHPDGRVDGLNWDLLNDGMGNPKNARSMLLASQTPPAMSTGVRPGAMQAVRAGIEHILFTQPDDSLSRLLHAYIRSLQPVSAPLEATRNVARGAKLFETLECAGCHPPPLYTDLKQYDVGTHARYDFTTNEEGRAVPQTMFDTPTLVESWRTAPYLHDGRYRTMEQVFVEGRHGIPPPDSMDLSQQDLHDLAAFVRSL